MDKKQVLSESEISKFYNSFGKKQDYQSFYEDKALNLLTKKSHFESANSIFEFGCGTGRFASQFLKLCKSSTSYVGVDISSTMINLSNKRLKSFGERVNVKLSSGCNIESEANCFDRFVSTYVLDLLPENQIIEVLLEAKRILIEGGLICLCGITTGDSIAEKLVSNIWSGICKIDPKIVGGCRPLEVSNILAKNGWNILFSKKISSWLISSEVIVAENIGI